MEEKNVIDAGISTFGQQAAVPGHGLAGVNWVEKHAFGARRRHDGVLPFQGRDAFAKKTVMDSDFDATKFQRAIDEGGCFDGQVSSSSQRTVRRATDRYSLEAPSSAKQRRAQEPPC